MMKVIKILLVLTVLFISINAVSAEGNFTALQDEINTSKDSINIQDDYVYDNATDYSHITGISISKSNFTINGNGHTIDGANQARIFEILADNITILNLNFINANQSEGGAIYAAGSITLKNVTFTNNTAKSGGAVHGLDSVVINNSVFSNNRAENGGAIFGMNKTSISNSVFSANTAIDGGAISNGMFLTTNNVTFEKNNASSQGGAIFSNGFHTSVQDKYINNYGDSGVICELYGISNLINGTFISENKLNRGLIYTSNTYLIIENATFANTVSRYATAIYMSESNGEIRNCDFLNLTASASGGAIGIKEMRDKVTIENCNFINTSSGKNGGGIFIDASKLLNSTRLKMVVEIINSTFINCSSEFGGAVLQLNGRLDINDSRFIKSDAFLSGGAIYTSFTDLNLKNTEITGNSAFKNGGAIYGELTNVTLDKTTLTANKVKNASTSNPDTIYAYDSSLYIRNSFFNNSKYSIISFFTLDYVNENNTLNYDEFSFNNTYYLTEVTDDGVKIELINNSIDVTGIPSRFDLREWGWSSQVKDQLTKGYCWVFGTISSLESALLKATGMKYNFSENNIGNNEIIYARYGNTEDAEGEMFTTVLGYLLSWFGPIAQEIDPYDELTKVSDFYPENKIHIQDVLLIPVKKSADNIVSNETNRMIKEALLKYGAVTMTYAGDGNYYDAKSKTIYNNETFVSNHLVSFIGWDDNFSKDNFNITPPGDGAWIFQNSWGSDWGDNGYAYISYYDTSLLGPDNSRYDEINYVVAFIIENTENYKYNYQTDLTGIRQFNGNYSYYANTYTAVANNLLGAVGTYFNDSGIDYEFKVYVNDELKLIQNGTSEFAGYRTIKLNEYIPVKENDIFKVVFKNNVLPHQAKSREHYMENMSFVSADGENWIDYAALNMTACLKVYAFDLAIYTEDLVKIYKNNSKFEANIGVSNESVTFEINGMNYTRLSDENGTVRMTINLEPGNYKIKTTFNGTTVENTITVLPTLIGKDLVKYYRNASQFFISLIDGEGNSVSGVNITMNINGVFYNRLTNENGTANLNINLEPGEYILTAIDPLTRLQMSYNITVLPVLIANDLEMKYKDGSTFNVMVLDGQGKPLANAKVTFNVNGVIYTRYSNSSGIAKLNINLMAGEYIITSEFDGMRISNTITIRDY